jgi:putative membrane protein
MNLSKSILFLALSGVSASAMAADADKGATNLPTFVSKAAQDGMTEVEAGKLALSKSNDQAIRGFAQRMIDDHGKANAELEQIATAKGVTPPKKLDAEHQAMVNTLKAVPAEQFDRQYAQHMNMDHTKAISLFEKASRADDPQLAAFAQKTLPTLKEHKQLAEKLPGNMKSGSMPGG